MRIIRKATAATAMVTRTAPARRARTRTPRPISPGMWAGPRLCRRGGAVRVAPGAPAGDLAGGDRGRPRGGVDLDALRDLRARCGGPGLEQALGVAPHALAPAAHELEPAPVVDRA